MWAWGGGGWVQLFFFLKGSSFQRGTEANKASNVTQWALTWQPARTCGCLVTRAYSVVVWMSVIKGLASRNFSKHGRTPGNAGRGGWKTGQELLVSLDAEDKSGFRPISPFIIESGTWEMKRRERQRTEIQNDPKLSSAPQNDIIPGFRLVLLSLKNVHFLCWPDFWWALISRQARWKVTLVKWPPSVSHRLN